MKDDGPEPLLVAAILQILVLLVIILYVLVTRLPANG